MLLNELVRQAERVIDRQIAAMRELDEKTGQMIRLAVAAAAGAIALGGLAGSPDTRLASLGFISAYLAGLLLNLTALAALLEAYVGLRVHTDLHIGPDLRWMAERSDRPGWSLRSHQSHLLEAYPTFGAYNARRMRRALAWRRRGLFGLGSGVACYVAAYIFILLGGI